MRRLPCGSKAAAGTAGPRRCRSSVVEHSLGKGEVRSSILRGSTSKPKEIQGFRSRHLPCPPLVPGEQDGNTPDTLGENRGTTFHDRSSFPIVVAEWPRNSREVVRVSIDVYNGRHTVNARIWFYDDADELRPGRTGIVLAVKHLPALADALTKALGAARDAGLLEEAPDAAR
jgi:hypothetical protein